jgi:hypothetical protein
VIAESGLAPPAIDRDALLAATAAAAGARTWAACDPPTKTLSISSVCMSPQPPYTPIDCPWGVSRASKYDTECQGQLAMPVGVAQTVDPTCTAYIPKTYEYSNDGSGSSVPPSSPPPPSPPPQAVEESSSSSSVGAIVGGVIGGLAVVALAVAAFLVYRQRRRKSETVADASNGYTVQHQQQLQQNGSMHPSAYGAPAYATVPREAASAGGWTSDGHASASASDVTRSTVITDSLTPSMASIAPPVAAAAAPRGNLAAWQLPYEDITIERPAPGYTTDGVFKAVWNHTAVAVQVVASAAVADSRDNATREVEAVAELQAAFHHPNIVQFLGYCTWPTCLVTEYVERGSLRAILADAAADPRRAAELTWERRMGVAWGACRALLFCHTRPAPIIHRAFSSMTLLVGADWTPKLAGFEHACVMGRSGEANGAIGNPRWMSPQSIDGTAPTPADDMYSFGMVLFELLTLQLPWGDAAPWAVVTEIQAGRRPVVPPAAQLGLRPTPSGLDAYVALMQRCWAQQPQDRPSFEQIMAELRAIAPGLE